MRVIITGGTGFIGSHLTDSLSADGHEVILLSRSPNKYRADVKPNVQLVEWDAMTGAGWDHLITADSAIVNLAGEPLDGHGFFPSRWTSERRRMIRESRVNAGRAIVSAVENASALPHVLIQQSAVGYYGYDREATFNEEAPPADDFASQVLVEWEATTAPLEAMGVRRPITRTGLLMHPTSGVMPRLLLPFRLFAGGPMGSGRQWYSWIHIADEVGAIRFLMDTEGLTGPFNLTAPHPVRNKEFAKTIGKVMKRPSLIPVPGPALRLAFGKVADLALEGQRAIPERLMQSGYNFRFAHLEPALRDLLA